MKATFVTKIRIAADQSLVFEYLTNLRYHQLWNPQIRSISSKGKLKLGSTYQTSSIVLGIKIHANNTVTKFVRPKEFELKNITGTVHFVANYRLKKHFGKTQIIATITLSTDSKAFVFTVPIMKQLAKRELRTDMDSLKVAVENRLD